MLAVLAIGFSYVAVIGGALGEVPAVIATWVALGTFVASAASLIADFRANRRSAPNPWAPAPSSTATRYLVFGGCAGGVVGIALILVDAWVLA